MRALFVFLLLCPASIYAAGPSTPRERVEAFFFSIQRNDFAGGYDRLFAGSSIPKDQPGVVSHLKSQTQNGLPAYGKILGYELMKEEDYGASVERFIYILKSEKAPTIWEFYFYKPNESWYVVNVIFSDQVTGLK